MLGAGRHEPSEVWLGCRNGCRPRLLTTQVGDIDLRIPKRRSGTVLPSVFEPRRLVDRAPHAEEVEAYVGRVSTWKIDALVAALASQSGISKAQVSRICADIVVQVQACLSRPPEVSGNVYLYLDATYRHGHSRAVFRVRPGEGR